MSEKNQPVHEIRLGAIRAAIWKNQADSGSWFNVTFERLYRQNGGKWQQSQSFGRDDLLVLAKVADLVHSWVCEQGGESESPPDQPAGRQASAQKKAG